ncbi:MAG: nuclear transport factor 2 family protein [Hyphomicrobiaceae bacterium]
MASIDQASSSDPTVEAAIARLHAAMARVAMGDVSAIKALYSHSSDATSFYGWGGYEKGWQAVSRRWDWAGQQFQGGSVSYQRISTVVAGDMFLVTDVESYTDQQVRNVEGLTGWSNRVTHVFRREGGEWRLVHRHANRHEPQFEPSTRLARR